MGLKRLTGVLLPAIEQELQRQVTRLDRPQTARFYEMLTYHMGWTGEGAGPEATGKRVRPLLLALVAVACGEEWPRPASAGAAIELIHNFSLIHDDIQDNSEKRRGRATVWKKWGEPMAINAGDALFVIANQAMLDLTANYPAETVIKAADVLQDACLNLTRGQFLDMLYEKRTDLTIEDYWATIEGKTAGLIAACTEIGAILAGAAEATINQYRIFGRNLGLAFQIQDDILGIWGDEALTGKSAASDLVQGKNSLPVLYGVRQRGRFAQRWARQSVRPEEVTELARMLKEDGIYDLVEGESKRLTNQALAALEAAASRGEAVEALAELADQLLHRET
jgi:geranylgeranyl diphosphate synthase type I